MNWLYAYAPVIAGVACGMALFFIFYIAAELIMWRFYHTNLIVIDNDLVQCLHCGTTFKVEGIEKLRYCPKCGREIEKIIDKE